MDLASSSGPFFEYTLVIAGLGELYYPRTASKSTFLSEMTKWEDQVLICSKKGD